MRPPYQNTKNRYMYKEMIMWNKIVIQIRKTVMCVIKRMANYLKSKGYVVYKNCGHEYVAVAVFLRFRMGNALSTRDLHISV